MTYVVTEACIKCKYMDCIEVCPVDCFYVGDNMLVIHPDECIDCGVCEPECPPEAIKPDTEAGMVSGWRLTESIRRAGRILPGRASPRPTPSSGRALTTNLPNISARIRENHNYCNKLADSLNLAAKSVTILPQWLARLGRRLV